GSADRPDASATGSSMMPQKKNPDVAELVRGKTGRTIGALVALLTVLKGLPLAYNRDLQEDKPALFDAAATLGDSLDVLAALVPRLRFDPWRVPPERPSREAGRGRARRHADVLRRRLRPQEPAGGARDRPPSRACNARRGKHPRGHPAHLAPAAPLHRGAAHARPRPLPGRTCAGRGGTVCVHARRHGRPRGPLPLPQGAAPRLGRPGGQGGRALPLPRDRGHARRVAEPTRRPGRDPLRSGQGSPMNQFAYRAGELHCEGVPLAPLAATLGTPLYVYSKRAIVDRFHAFDTAFAGVPHLVCFA